MSLNVHTMIDGEVLTYSDVLAIPHSEEPMCPDSPAEDYETIGREQQFAKERGYQRMTPYRLARRLATQYGRR